MEIIKWTALSFLFVLLALNCYQAIAAHTGISKSGVLLILLISAVLLKRGRIYWWLGVLLFIYGLYNLFFLAARAAEPTVMEFTSNLNYFFFGHRTRNPWHHVIKLVPFIFYLLGLIFLLSKPGRKYYFENR
ncbi:hypothetical protein ACTJJ0_33220 [Chitinophaga sp. 22321]|uniref:Transmembrane family 220, helix n=1 Tax=Chitinophaga hostae TaxID=2831022 RepID=A0ABS5JA94_9BACT|nr:hypothetical protein [Chitinophaga hostae]MBS0032016.1 hypothetical protein [Chitinophaga hostae]